MIKCAVIIPIHRWPLTDSEAFSVHKTITLLKEHDIFWISPDFLSDTLPSNYKGKTIIFLGFQNEFFKSISGYSRLLMSGFFYDKFAKYTHMLIVQPDALIFQDKISHWCSKDYSYIGAPWFKGMRNPDAEYKLFAVGNGGFSLRCVQDHIRFLNTLKYTPFQRPSKKTNSLGRTIDFIRNRLVFSYSFPPFQPRVNEDYFWGLIAPNHDNQFNVAPPSVALNFSFEVAPTKMFELNNRQLPFGCHAWEKYDRQFWMEKLGEEFFNVDPSMMRPLVDCRYFS